MTVSEQASTAATPESANPCIQADIRLMKGAEGPRIAWRYAVAADITAYFGAPRLETCRAVVVTMDEKPVGIIALVSGGGCWTIQSEYKPELEPYLRSMPVLRAIKAAMRWVKSSHKRVYAIRDEGTDALLRLGFECIDGDVYQWPNPAVPKRLLRMSDMRAIRTATCDLGLCRSENR